MTDATQEMIDEVKKVLEILDIPYSNNVTVKTDSDFYRTFGKRMKTSVMGVCHIQNMYTLDETNNVYTMKHIYTIYVQSGLGVKNTLETLFHEFIHTCKGCADHGKLFKAYADKVNRYINENYPEYNGKFRSGYHEGTFENLEYIKSKFKYVIVCQGCNKRNYFARKSKTYMNILSCSIHHQPSSYHCTVCGSRELVAEEV